MNVCHPVLKPMDAVHHSALRFILFIVIKLAIVMLLCYARELQESLVMLTAVTV